jgi:LacI family transcriptional regulator
MKNPTIKDVAKGAGVSIATVSNVLSGKTGEVSATTTERVLQKARELGYVKNLAASSLSGRPSHLLAVVFPGISLPATSSEVRDVNPFYGDFILCLEREAAAQGFDLMVSSGRADTNRPLHFQRHVDAAIVVGNSYPLSVLERLHMRIVLVDPLLTSEEFMCVRTNEDTGAALSAGHLIGKGRTKLAYIGYNVFEFPTNLTSIRYDAAKRICDEAGVVLDVVEEWTTFEGGQRAAARVAELACDGVMTSADIVAAGLLEGLKKLGRRVPEDVAVMGYDNLPIASMVSPALSTIDQCLAGKARHAIDLVRDGHAGEVREVEPRLVLRDSA